MKFFKTLNFKIIISFIIVSFLPLGTLYYFTYENSRVALEKSIGTKFQTKATQSMEDLFLMIREARRDLENWASNKTLQKIALQGDHPSLQYFMKQLKKRESPYWVISVMQPGGKILASTNSKLKNINVSKEKWYQAGVKAKDFLAQDLNFFKKAGGLVLTLSLPIYWEEDSRKVLGHLFLHCNWKALIDNINSIKIGGVEQNQSQYAILINRNGEIIAAPEFIFRFKTNQNFLSIWDYKFPKQNFNATKQAQNGSRGFLIEKDPLGREFLIGYAGSAYKGILSSFNWSVLVMQETHKAFAPTIELREKFFQFGFLVVVLTIILAVAISTQIRSPISKLINAAQDISKGQLPPAIEIKSDDELGTLAKAFNQMINDLKVTQESLILSKENAEKANNAKSDFLAKMSHELRTPLNAILGFAQVLKMPTGNPLNESQSQNLDFIIKGGNHLLELINEILDLSKIESGKLQLSIENVNIGPFLEETLDLAKPLGDKYGVVINNEINLSSEDFIVADYFRLRQVVLNLLSNAIKYNKPNGSVSLGYKVLESEFIQVYVKDTGLGISDKDKKAIFEPFNRLSNQNSSIEGTGIGLTISKNLIEAMSGSIYFSTTLGQGTTFYIDLPKGKAREKSNLTQPKIKTIEKIEKELDEISILYIEDNPVNLKLVKEIIGHNYPNIKLISAPEAISGIELAMSRQPDLILLDINLPEMDGITAFKIFKSKPETKFIPIWAISANAMKKDIQRARDLGFENYIVKPLDVPEFIENLDEFLNHIEVNKNREKHPLNI